MEKRGKDLAKLDYVMNTLSQHGTLPPKHRIHKLVGNHAGRWECHIEPNWLLIYTLDETTLTLLDTGTHSDLF
jgi:mRNA interferase YafQ